MNVVSARRVLQSDWKTSGVPFYRAREIVKLYENGYVNNELFISEDLYTELSQNGAPGEGDIMVTAVGTLGKTYIVQKNDKFYYKDASVICFENFGKLYAPYIQLFIESPYMGLQIKQNVSGTTVGTITIVKANDYLFPIPPLSEQRRIVAKIEELLPYIENYTQTETKLNALNTTFPTQLKKSILQQAVQGKLVPQNPDDEPASVLLERIRAEKQELIKAGKIKKDKNESVIFRRDNSHYEMVNGVERCIDDEIPFEVPKSWEWSRLGSLVQVNPRNSIDDETDVGFIPMPLIKEGFSNSHSFETRKWKDIKSGFTHFADGDVVIAKITPCFQNRKSAIISELPNGYGAGTTELHVLRDNTKLLYTPYLLLICKTHDFIENGMKNFTGTAGQQRIGKDFVSNYLIPIPPYEEQRRIVEAIENLIPYCQKI